MAASKIHPSRIIYQYTPFYHFLFCSILVGLLLVCCFIFVPWESTKIETQFELRLLDSSPQVVISSSSPEAESWDEACSHYNCFDVYKCGHFSGHITVYIYPIIKYVDENGVPLVNQPSLEFMEILETILKSPYYTSDPKKACLFIPSIDLLNQRSVNTKAVSQILASLPYWNNGTNHLLFNMLPGVVPNYSTVLDMKIGRAAIAGGGFSTWTYRRSFDISIPIYNPTSQKFVPEDINEESSRQWFVISSQINIHYEYIHEMELAANNFANVLLLKRCGSWSVSNINATIRCRGSEIYDYPEVLQEGNFCMVIRGARLGQYVLSDAMMSGCIPVIVADEYVLPFSEVLDWKRIAVRVYEDDLGDLMKSLRSLSDERISEMRQQGYAMWGRYFSSIPAITRTVMDIVNNRVFTHNAKTYEDWNTWPSWLAPRPPLFLPMISPKSRGFTAVVLTYDRLESLFQVVQKIAQAQSLSKVVVVWNNLKKAPPPESQWPKISRPLKVITTRENKLSNRFFPYTEIETDAVLAIDDDILMLTADELEFGFEVWREFSDRIVGFPSRVHLWDNATSQWKYESEWTNDISMVLTGAAFYHKYYSYLYTYSMPKEIKDWVDKHMNCEDIAMNFLVSNLTGKAPIKVAPRKKFKCPECTKVENLSSDIMHMQVRSECINYFARVYGRMPLKTVEFRADPVLYKDNFPDKLKKFNNVGSL